MLVGPGTSGRTWRCGSCGRDWTCGRTSADVQRPQLRRVLVVDLDGTGSRPDLVEELVVDVRQHGLATVTVYAGEEIARPARILDAAIGEPELVDGSAPSMTEDAALVQHATDILAMIGSGELADAVRRLARRARR
jgi:hypothetical protein